MIAPAKERQVIVRTRGRDIIFIQLDDLTADKQDHLASAVDTFEILGALQEARIVMDLARLGEASNADYDGAIARVDRALAALETAMMTESQGRPPRTTPRP